MWLSIMHDFFTSSCRQDEVNAELRVAFDMFDLDSSGTIDSRELEALLGALDVKFTEKQLNDIIAEADVNMTGVIEYEEFKVIMNTLKRDHIKEVPSIIPAVSWCSPHVSLTGLRVVDTLRPRRGRAHFARGTTPDHAERRHRNDSRRSGGDVERRRRCPPFIVPPRHPAPHPRTTL
jgi:hypothetical protein